MNEVSNDAPGSRSRGPLIIAFLVGGALLLGLGMFADRVRSAPERTLPQLSILAPAAADTLAAGAPLTVQFHTDAPLELGPMGWAARDLHPHILLDGVEHMAAAADITALADSNTYRWALPVPQPGPHTLLLTWAGSHHGIVGDTIGQTRLFFVTEPAP
jgi:hypothetical protein